MFAYQGSTALVTGASKGLGAAYARALAKRGMRLVLVARSTGALEDLAAQLSRDFSTSCTVIAADLGKADAARRIAEQIDDRGIVVDLVVNNAGLGLTGPFTEHDLGAELNSIQVNVSALTALTYLMAKGMIERGRGAILNLASNAAFLPLPNMATYAAAKAYVLFFSEALAVELNPHGVSVLAVCPGPTATDFFGDTNTNLAAKDFDTAEQVVERSLFDLDRGKIVSYPGRRSVRIGTLLPRLFPRRMTLAFAGQAMRKMGLA